MRVPGPNVVGAGLCARDRVVGVDDRSSSRYFDVYRLEVLLGVASAAAMSGGGRTCNDVGRIDISLFGVPSVVDEAEAMLVPAFRACFPAMLSLDRRISNSSASS